MTPRRRRCAWITGLLALIGVTSTARAGEPSAAAQPGVELRAPAVAPDPRLDWWREARFGMFIHWGVYSVPATIKRPDGSTGTAEWHLLGHQVQVADYEKFAPRFNPVRFDAAEWVRIAKDAGMKYIVITSKHHDGFCMYDSKLTDWTITKATPFKRDPLKELADECARQGVRLGFYYSIMDWHHPDYLPRRAWEKGQPPAEQADFARYVEYMKGQLEELVGGRYGKVAVLWFDGEWEETWNAELGWDLYRYVRSLDPDIIVNNRVGKGRGGMAGLTAEGNFAGDFGTPEQEIPNTGLPGVDWESCMTMNDTWGYATDDHNWKSATTLIRNLCDTAGKGGNFLLNVGPTAEGLIPAESVERLAAMGRWVRANGEAVHGTHAGPWRRVPFNGRISVKGEKLYLHVFEWPRGQDGAPTELVFPGLRTEIRAARVPATGQTLSAIGWMEGAVPMVLVEPPDKLDEAATVVELDLAGPVAVVERAPAFAPDEKGVVTLRAADAEVVGTSARYESGERRDCIGFWTNAGDHPVWVVELPAPGRYTIEATTACTDGEAGSIYSVGPEGGARVRGTVTPTGDWGNFETQALGVLDLAQGRTPISVRIESLKRSAAMNLRSIRLVPAR